MIIGILIIIGLALFNYFCLVVGSRYEKQIEAEKIAKEIEELKGVKKK